MDAKIDPKVVTDLSIFKSGGWNIFMRMNRGCGSELQAKICS